MAKKNGETIAALVFGGMAGGLGGGLLGYSKGYDDGYAKAKGEDAPYVRALEDENARLHLSNGQLLAALLEERRRKSLIEERISAVTVK